VLLLVQRLVGDARLGRRAGVGALAAGVG
jgi:hypothetical protein